MCKCGSGGRSARDSHARAFPQVLAWKTLLDTVTEKPDAGALPASTAAGLSATAPPLPVAELLLVKTQASRAAEPSA